MCVGDDSVLDGHRERVECGLTVLRSGGAGQTEESWMGKSLRQVGRDSRILYKLDESRLEHHRVQLL